MNENTEARLVSISPVLQSAKLTGKVSAHKSVMRFEQVYRNANDCDVEISYTFPTPPEATLTKVALFLNGEEYTGTVSEKRSASTRYEEAIEDGDAAILLERSGPGLYTINLGNLKPGEEAKLAYDWILPASVSRDTMEISIPTTIKDRYGNPLTEGRLRANQVPRQNALVEYPFSVELTFDNTCAYGSISCPSHDSAKVTKNEDPAVKTLIINEESFLDRDLRIIVSGLRPVRHVETTVSGGEYLTHIAVSAPSASSIKDMAIKLLIDCSGSMQGQEIEQAKMSAKHLVSKLSSKDLLSISSFGSKVFHKSKELEYVTKENSKKFTEYIQSLSANLGGTELEEALISTIRAIDNKESHTSPAILLITDGASWAHRKIIRAAKHAGHRIFCIGVGKTPAASLLYELSQYTSGAYRLISDTENLNDVIDEMLGKIRSASSVRIRESWLADGQIWSSNSTRSNVYPSELVHIFHRGITPPQGPLRIEMWDNGDLIEDFTIEPVASLDQQLTKLVASVEIASTTQSVALDLALRHQLISEQTSLVIVNVREADEKALGIPKSVAVEHMVDAHIAACRPLYSLSDAPVARTGSYDVLGEIGHSMHDIPTVWRSPSKSEDQARRLALEEGGMDRLDIPAFLRRSAHSDSAEEKHSTHSKGNAWRKMRDLFKGTKDSASKKRLLEALEAQDTERSNLNISTPINHDSMVNAVNEICETETSMAQVIKRLLADHAVPIELLVKILRLTNLDSRTAISLYFLALDESNGLVNVALSGRARKVLQEALIDVAEDKKNALLDQFARALET